MSFFREPDHIFDRLRAGPLTIHEIDACQSLFTLIKNTVVRSTVSPDDIHRFLEHMHPIGSEWRAYLVIYKVVFLGIMAQMPVNNYWVNKYRIVYKLLRAVQIASLAPGLDTRTAAPLNRNIIIMGLGFTYRK